MLDSSASSSVPGPDGDRPERAALVLQVAEELSGVVHRVLAAGHLPQDVGRVLAGGQQDHVTLPHLQPPGGDVALARSGRAYGGVAGAVAGHGLVQRGGLGQGKAAGQLPGRLAGLLKGGCL